MRTRCPVTLLLCGLLAQGLAAQQATQPPPEVPYVLHVYENLVQVPTLVLTQDLQPIPPLPKDRIFISLDSGPRFHPVHMHIEGEEPISLAILVDASNSSDPLLQPLRAAVADLAKNSLLLQDDVSIFTADCRLIRTGLSLHPDPDELQGAVQRGFDAPTLHAGKKHTCAHSIHLWDDTALVLKSISSLPGRRVLLIVSDGEDHGSSLSWNIVRQYADEKSIAIFGLRSILHAEAERGFDVTPLSNPRFYTTLSFAEDPYTQLCELTGGLVLPTSGRQLSESLQRFLAMVRGRYILEFPRPENTSGYRTIDVNVTVPSMSTYITTAGVIVPLPDPSLQADPTTVPSSASPAVLGKRRSLTH